MKHQLFDTNVHIATGGRTFNNDGEILVFIHGSGQSHLTWILQSRYFAYRGYQVLAPDFPGHGLSGGTPLDSIEAMADWVIALLDSLDVNTACLVGHSQGCLVTIDAAARYPDRIARGHVRTAGPTGTLEEVWNRPHRDEDGQQQTRNERQSDDGAEPRGSVGSTGGRQGRRHEVLGGHDGAAGARRQPGGARRPQSG